MIKIDGSFFEYDYNDSFAYRLFKALSKGAGLDLKRAVDKFNKTFPDINTTPQNVSNKLSRDSIKLTEFCKFAEAFGYEIIFKKIGDAAPEDDSQTAPRSKRERTSAENQIREPHRPIRIKDDVDKKETGEHTDISFLEAVNQGCAVVKRKHRGEFIFAGKRAKEAAQAYEEHNTVDGDGTDNPQHIEMREISLAANIELMFGVQFRIVY